MRHLADHNLDRVATTETLRAVAAHAVEHQRRAMTRRGPTELATDGWHTGTVLLVDTDTVTLAEHLAGDIAEDAWLTVGWLVTLRTGELAHAVLDVRAGTYLDLAETTIPHDIKADLLNGLARVVRRAARPDVGPSDFPRALRHRPPESTEQP